MTVPDDERAEFEAAVRNHFAFLSETGLTNRGVRAIGAGGRDSGLAARYEAPGLRLEIGWSKYELSLAVLLKFNFDEMPEEQRYVYFEPFVEFLTGGRDTAIVPYVTDNMRAGSIERVIAECEAVFADGLEAVAQRLGEKLRQRLDLVRAASSEQIRAYHDWISGIR
jgi:hypothetical protein